MKNGMTSETTKPDLDFVRRASKEIACCLLPDEFPYFDIIWQAIGPMLKKSAFHLANKTDILSRSEDRLGSLAFSAGWSKDADLLTAPLIMVFGSSLENAISKGVCSEDEVGEIVAERSLRWSLPEEFLLFVQTFVADVCGAMAEPKTEVEKLISHAKSLLPHKSCYYVFHHGDYHYYPDKLPEHVVALRDNALFWINKGDTEFFCRGEPREESDCPTKQKQKMLRFLCMKKNADTIVSFEQLYQHAWKPNTQTDVSRMRSSIHEAQNALNNFTDHRFIVSDKSQRNRVPVFSIHGEDKYEINANAPKECCIITKFTLME